MIKKTKNIIVTMVIAGVLSISGILSVSAFAASESQEWNLYYNDSFNNSTVGSLKFNNYLGWYTAAPTYRSSSDVYTLIQPNTAAGTNTEKASYLVAGGNVRLYVSNSNGENVYLIAKLSYRVAPSAMSGILSHN